MEKSNQEEVQRFVCLFRHWSAHSRSGKLLSESEHNGQREVSQFTISPDPSYNQTKSRNGWLLVFFFFSSLTHWMNTSQSQKKQTSFQFNKSSITQQKLSTQNLFTNISSNSTVSGGQHCMGGAFSYPSTLQQKGKNSQNIRFVEFQKFQACGR